MAMQTHGDVKYRAASLLSGPAEVDVLRVEHRRIGPGAQNCVRPECTELVCILSGQAKVRRIGDGQLQEGMALPGTSWLVPAGTDETLLELDGTTECLVVFLPADPMTEAAASLSGMDPGSIRLAYAGGMADPTLTQIGAALRGLIGGCAEPIQRLFAASMAAALAAHLVGNYRVGRWQQPSYLPSLDPRRLRRVLDLIEARFGEALTLTDMAAEACLSPFHFSRLFAQTTGRSPHRYLTERRIEAAPALLRQGTETLAGVALDVGFGSQASFSRCFHKACGVTPGEYRRLHAGRAISAGLSAIAGKSAGAFTR